MIIEMLRHSARIPVVISSDCDSWDSSHDDLYSSIRVVGRGPVDFHVAPTDERKTHQWHLSNGSRRKILRFLKGTGNM